MAFEVGRRMNYEDIIAAGGPEYEDGETAADYYSKVMTWVQQAGIDAQLDEQGYPVFYGYTSTYHEPSKGSAWPVVVLSGIFGAAVIAGAKKNR